MILLIRNENFIHRNIPGGNKLINLNYNVILDSMIARALRLSTDVIVRFIKSYFYKEMIK